MGPPARPAAVRRNHRSGESMPTFALRRFSCAETLKAIAPEHFIAFLKPHRRFLTSRGLSWPAAGKGARLDYEGLVGVFLSPDAATPKELVDALYFVDELATPEGMDGLLAEAERRGLARPGGPQLSPADVAVRIWLLDKDIVERKHAEHYLAKVRSFESYQMELARKGAFRRPTAAQLETLAGGLDDWFEGRKRGRGAKVILCDRPDGMWFLVRHGEPFKREESLEGLQASSVCYRPLKYDVLVFLPQIGELRIHAQSKGETQLY